MEMIDYSHYGHVPDAGKLLFERKGEKYLHKIDCVKYCNDTFYGKKAYVHSDGTGFYVTEPERIVEVDEADVVKCFGKLYKWKVKEEE